MICDGDRFEKIFERERESFERRESVSKIRIERVTRFSKKKKVDLIHIQIIFITHHPILHT